MTSALSRAEADCQEWKRRANSAEKTRREMTVKADNLEKQVDRLKEECAKWEKENEALVKEMEMQRLK